MVREEIGKLEQDKKFTTYTRKSRKNYIWSKRENNGRRWILQQSQYDYIQGLETRDKEKEPQEQKLSGKKKRKLERKVEKLQQQLMESEVLERVVKRENETIRTQSKKFQDENEKLKKKVRRLQAYKVQIGKRAYKLYKQKKAIKTKY